MKRDTDSKVKPVIVAVILTLNQKDSLVRCLRSLIETEQGVPFETVVWDNGSIDGTDDIVRSFFPLVDYVYCTTNLGVASGRNAGAQRAMLYHRATHILFLDNDMIVEPGFIRGLWNAFRSDVHVAQAQGKLRLMDDPQRLNDGGGVDVNFWLGRTFPVAYGEVDCGQYDQVKPCIACGGATMVRADVFRQLNGFDAAFDPFGPEDIDFSLRLVKAGYKALFIPQSVAYHAISHTYGRDYDAAYARKKIQFWLMFLIRHANWPQKFGFFLVGAPFSLALLCFREVRRGNIRVFKGLWLGLWDFVRRPGTSGWQFSGGGLRRTNAAGRTELTEINENQRDP